MEVNCSLFNEIEAEARKRSGDGGVQVKVAFAVLIEKVQELQARVDALEASKVPPQEMRTNYDNIPLPRKTMMHGNGRVTYEGVTLDGKPCKS